MEGQSHAQEGRGGCWFQGERGVGRPGPDLGPGPQNVFMPYPSLLSSFHCTCCVLISTNCPYGCSSAGEAPPVATEASLVGLSRELVRSKLAEAEALRKLRSSAR